MASIPSNSSIKVERLSFAKIAAAGIKPTSAPHLPQSGPTPANDLTKAPYQRDATYGVSPLDASHPRFAALQQAKSMQLAARNLSEQPVEGRTSSEVLVRNAEGLSSLKRKDNPASSLRAPDVDDGGTQVSSSSGSVKPSSTDGKSVASGTTFALDEKESLRPDDSASLKAVDDEDVFSPTNTEREGVVSDFEDGTRAFNEQLREIDSMEPPHVRGTPQHLLPGVKASRGVLYVPPQGPGVGHVPAMRDEAGHTANPLPDSKLLEALESPRDRIWVLKLEQDIFDFVKDPKESSLELPQCNAYHRMLAHKIADYYTLGHLVDDSASAVRLFKTPDLRIPPPLTGITTPSTAASTPPPAAPQMKILRRSDGGSASADGYRNSSKTNSETGESGNEDDKSKPATREEREARYAAARLRIMGSFQASELVEAPIESEEPRPISTAGKKGRKKQRSDSEDGFEARSAFVHYAQPFGANAYGQSAYGYPGYTEQTGVKLNSPMTYNTPDDTSAFRRYPPQSPGVGGTWTGQGFTHANEAQKWQQTVQPGYDLASDFQNSISLGHQATSSQVNVQPTTFNTAYSNQCYPSVQASWQQQNPQMIQQSQQYNHPQYSQIRPTSSSSYNLESQRYQFGQLPSQTFPGRPSSSLEHPLPGSYKSKHFDPQSQTFVPGGGSSFRSFTPQGAPASSYTPGYGYPGPLQRQSSSQSQVSLFGPSHVSGGVAISHQTSPQHMTQQSLVHPLPQPVFPRQPSPSLPLPAKPNLSQRASSPHQQSAVHTSGGTSSIAKWGAPASLPAKPPPSVEPFDSTRYPQTQRQPSYGTAATARPAGVTLESNFHSPVLANGSGVPVVVNGSSLNTHQGP